METTLIIDGGLGRVITAIPALEKFVKNNPDCIIVGYGFTPIFWGNKLLRDNVFDNYYKGLFQKIKDTKILKPDPYFNSDYLNGRINLLDAWNQEINNDKESMPIPKLYLSQQELINNGKFKTKDNIVIGFQPYGSSAILTENSVDDSSVRSLSIETTQAIVKALRKEKYDILLITDKQIPFLQAADFINHYPPDLRGLMGSIANVDYFLGIDSLGQHIARAFNKPGTVIFGGTNPVNVSYPGYFNFINDKAERSYMHYRVAEFDWWLTEIENSNIMKFSNDENKSICDNIIKHIKSSLRK